MQYWAIVGHIIFSKNKFIKSLNIIEFGLGTNITFRNVKNYISKPINHFVETLMFASTAVLIMVEKSPKDNLESLCYMLVYFKNGYLPWQKYQNLEKHLYLKEILNMHKNYSIEKKSYYISIRRTYFYF